MCCFKGLPVQMTHPRPKELWTEPRGFAPIGMLEGWNYGIMGYGKLEWWINGEIHLDKKLRDL